MTAQKSVLVIAPAHGKHARFFPTDLRIGWRAQTTDGPYDFMWGRCKPGSLDALIADVESKLGAVEVLRLTRGEDLRDCEWYDEHPTTAPSAILNPRLGARP